jgi:hypothetical protein
MRRCIGILLVVGLMVSVANATSDWTGAVDNDWANGGNWSDGGPDNTERRDIALGNPVVTADDTAGVVHMGRTNTSQTISNASLTISSGTLTVTSGGTELVSVAYDDVVTNNLNIEGGNLVVYRGNAGGEIRMAHDNGNGYLSTCVGNITMSSGSIDFEVLNHGDRDATGVFTATGGTLIARDEIDKFGTVSGGQTGFSLGGATLEIADWSDRSNEIGHLEIGNSQDTDFFMDSTSTLVLDLGNSSWDNIVSWADYVIDGSLIVHFSDAPSLHQTWDVWTINAGDEATYSGSGMFDTITPDYGTIIARWIDTGNGTDTLQLEYVPEPATIALLGLGFLAIRRNKK